MYAHNVYNVDAVIDEAYSGYIQKNEKNQDQLLLDYVSGSLQYIYFQSDYEGNTICIMLPFWEVFMRDFCPMLVVGICLILFEIYLYIKNKNSLIEFHRRDLRLTALADAAYDRRIYVNISDMTFRGGEYEAGICKTNEYQELYGIFEKALVEENDISQLKEYISEEQLKKDFIADYMITAKRFFNELEDA